MINYRARFLLEFLYVEDIMRDGIDIDKLLKEYDEGNTLQLQDFIGKYIQNHNTWMTSIGLIDAMDAVYKDAKENGNITE